MIKIEVIIGSKVSGSFQNTIMNYTYLVKILGIIIHSFHLQTDVISAQQMFGEKRMEKAYKKREKLKLPTGL